MKAPPGVTRTWLEDTARIWIASPEEAVATLERQLESVRGSAAGKLATAEIARVEARLGQLRIFLGRLDVAIAGLRSALASEEDGYLRLQLASARYWTGGPGAHEEAGVLVGEALRDARLRRDGPLATASLCLWGDLALAAGRAADAVTAFGEALGLSEFASSEVASITPLAGLARAHLAWRAPSKAAPLARRALERAERAGDLAGSARALLALGSVSGELETLRSAAEAADRAPHRPLALYARLVAMRFGSGDHAELSKQAAAMGMREPHTPASAEQDP